LGWEKASTDFQAPAKGAPDRSAAVTTTTAHVIFAPQRD
jgi:hypothetical protein